VLYHPMRQLCHHQEEHAGKVPAQYVKEGCIEAGCVCFALVSPESQPGTFHCFDTNVQYCFIPLHLSLQSVQLCLFQVITKYSKKRNLARPLKSKLQA